MRQIVLIACMFWVCGCSRPPASKAPALVAIREMIATNTDTLVAASDGFIRAAEERKFASLQARFKALRLAYKRTESITEYYFPGVSKAINGPAIDKVEDGDDKVIEATGFQVLEEYLFPGVDSVLWNGMLDEARILRASLIRLRELVRNNEFSHANILDALQLQVIRTMSLGLSGFDSPVALNSIDEADAAFGGMARMVSCYREETSAAQPALDTLDARIRRARAYLAVNRNFATFDRAAFIVRYCNPVAAALVEFRTAANIPFNPWPSAVDLSKRTIFEPRALNAAFFAPSVSRGTNDDRKSLGELLFFDPALSGNGRRTCSSCHQPARAFTDGRARGTRFNFSGVLERNSPTLINSGFQQSQFWDARVAYLEDQVSDVVANADELHGDLRAAAALLSTSEEYKQRFGRAFGDPSITAARIQSALATYVRSLEGLDSRFDQYMNGRTDAMTTAELDGFNLFMGKAKCGTCHFLPLFNGSVPPLYSETEAEVLGVPASPVFVNARPDPDEGRFRMHRHPLLGHMFKTPTVRNAELTAPYMHNGVFGTLEEVVEFYNAGGGSGIGIALDNQTLPAERLELTEEEKHNLVVFMRSLTDTTGLTRVPSTLPALKGISRKPGGDY